MLLGTIVGVGCRDNAGPTAEGDASLLAVSYVCGRTFELRNGNPIAVTIEYAVAGSGEAGELTLGAAPAPGQTSRTMLITLSGGTLRVEYGTETVGEAPNPGSACPAPVPAPPEPQATVGQWGAPFAWPVVAVHLHLLPSGRVLSWGGAGEPQVWDPASGAFIEVPSASHLFCAGHSFLPDGRLLVAGGHLSDDHGIPDANLFDPETERWVPVAPMARGRWYPTNTTLPDGRVLTLAGRDQDGVEVAEPEVWDGSRWTRLPGASRVLPYYPRTFVAPSGLVFYAGELQQSGYLDPSGSGSWTPVALSNYGRRDYGSAVMYAPGKVLIVGGSDPADGAPTNTAEVIDLNQPVPVWSYTDPMTNPRRQFNATLLPDGRVVVTGGTSSAGFSDPGGAIHAAEVWDPATGHWATWATNSVIRVYHSTTLLLPDGRLLHSGSGDGANVTRELSAELFSPPYLFRGPRPVIANAPATVGYGAEFFVATPDAGRITDVTWVRLSSVTHAFDENQRFNRLEFRRTAGGVTAVTPARGALAPPGNYLLFIVDGDGVPSVAWIQRVG